MKSEVTATKSELLRLSNTIDVQMKSLNDNLEKLDLKFDAKFSAIRVEVKEDETQYWTRMAFNVSDLLRICYILPSNNEKMWRR